MPPEAIFPKSFRLFRITLFSSFLFSCVCSTAMQIGLLKALPLLWTYCSWDTGCHCCCEFILYLFLFMLGFTDYIFSHSWPSDPILPLFPLYSYMQYNVQASKCQQQIFCSLVDGVVHCQTGPSKNCIMWSACDQKKFHIRLRKWWWRGGRWKHIRCLIILGVDIRHWVLFLGIQWIGLGRNKMYF